MHKRSMVCPASPCAKRRATGRGCTPVRSRGARPVGTPAVEGAISPRAALVSALKAGYRMSRVCSRMGLNPPSTTIWMVVPDSPTRCEAVMLKPPATGVSWLHAPQYRKPGAHTVTGNAGLASESHTRTIWYV